MTKKQDTLAEAGHWPHTTSSGVVLVVCAADGEPWPCAAARKAGEDVVAQDEPDEGAAAGTEA